MDDEKMIALVENNDVLYNKFKRDYKIPDKKRAVWSKISKEMGIQEELCIKRWSSLRDRFAKEKKNVKLASGSGAAFRHRWHYMQQLEFLSPHVISRPVRSTINIVDQISPVLEKSSGSVQYSIPECCEDSQTSYKSLQLADTPFMNAESEESLIVSPVATPQPLQSKKKKKKRIEQSDDSDQMFADAVEKFKNFCKSKEEKQKQKDDDAIYAFCKMICATLNSLSENKQTRVIKKISDVLTQLKLVPE